MNTPTYWAWLAGFFDGEGHVSIADHHFRMTITQKDLWILEELQDELKIPNPVFQINKKRSSGPVHRLRIPATLAPTIIPELLPYARVKGSALETALHYLRN
jgi:hypothetical protein